MAGSFLCRFILALDGLPLCGLCVNCETVVSGILSTVVVDYL